jgi:hypothetical protein
MKDPWWRRWHGVIPATCWVRDEAESLGVEGKRGAAGTMLLTLPVALVIDVAMTPLRMLGRLA